MRKAPSADLWLTHTEIHTYYINSRFSVLTEYIHNCALWVVFFFPLKLLIHKLRVSIGARGDGTHL